jgi:leader peptidase (prepilin peptidase) / N-methyltransferase
MNLVWAAAGAVGGALAGGAIRGTVFRLSVPSGDPERIACPRCGSPAGGRLALRCAQCKSSLGAPLALELSTGAVLALVLGRFSGEPVAAAFGFFAVLGVALAAIDISVQRLPNALTLPAYPILIGLLTVAAIANDDFAALLRALLGGLVLAGVYVVLALIGQGHMGGGDIKFAGVAGLVLGWLGWPVLIAGAALGFVLSAVASGILLATRRITLRSAICYGPFLFAGALLAMLADGR